MSNWVKKVNQWLQKFTKIFIESFINSDINNAAIVMAYYTLLAIFPTVILIGNLLPLLNIKSTTIMSYLETAVPATIYNTLQPLVKNFLDNGSGGLASVSALVAIWAVSRGINALKLAINKAYGVGDTQSAIVTRVVSILLIFVFGIALVIIFLFFSFGQIVLENLGPIFNLPLSWLTTFKSLKWPTTIFGIFGILCLVYRFLPNAKVHGLFILPGALIGTTSWVLITQGFSIYVHYFARGVLSYGTLGTFIFLLFWLNYSGWVILLGAVFNATLERLKYGQISAKKPTIKKIWDNVLPQNDKKKDG